MTGACSHALSRSTWDARGPKETKAGQVLYAVTWQSESHLSPSRAHPLLRFQAALSRRGASSHSASSPIACLGSDVVSNLHARARTSVVPARDGSAFQSQCFRVWRKRPAARVAARLPRGGSQVSQLRGHHCSAEQQQQRASRHPGPPPRGAFPPHCAPPPVLCWGACCEYRRDKALPVLAAKPVFLTHGTPGDARDPGVRADQDRSRVKPLRWDGGDAPGTRPGQRLSSGKGLTHCLRPPSLDRPSCGCQHAAGSVSTVHRCRKRR